MMQYDFLIAIDELQMQINELRNDVSIIKNEFSFNDDRKLLKQNNDVAFSMDLRGKITKDVEKYARKNKINNIKLWNDLYADFGKRTGKNPYSIAYQLNVKSKLKALDITGNLEEFNTFCEDYFENDDYFLHKKTL